MNGCWFDCADMDQQDRQPAIGSGLNQAPLQGPRLRHLWQRQQFPVQQLPQRLRPGPHNAGPTTLPTASAQHRHCGDSPSNESPTTTSPFGTNSWIRTVRALVANRTEQVARRTAGRCALALASPHRPAAERRRARPRNSVAAHGAACAELSAHVRPCVVAVDARVTRAIPTP